MDVLKDARSLALDIREISDDIDKLLKKNGGKSSPSVRSRIVLLRSTAYDLYKKIWELEK